MQKLPARLDWNLSCEILCNSTQQWKRNSTATKGTKYLSRQDKRLCHQAGCHSEVEREGNAMSLDQLGPREPKMQFFWISFSRTVCDVAKLGHGKNCCRDPWRTICAFFVTPYATLKTYWTPNGVTVCYYSSGVEVESLAHRQTRLQAKKRDIIFLIHSDTHRLIHTWWRRNGMWDLVKDGT